MFAFILGLMIGGSFGFILCGILTAGGEDKIKEAEMEAFNKGYAEGKKAGYKKGYKDCMEDEGRNGQDRSLQ